MSRNNFGIFIVLLLCLVSTSLKAQWDTSFTQFWMIKNSYNPSFAGASGEINISALNKRMYSGVEDVPSVMHIAGSMPFQFLGLNHGVGAVFSNSKVGKVHNNFMAIQYSYNQRIGNSMLSAGVQLGYHEMNYDAASMHFRVDSSQNQRKEIVVNPVEKKRADISAGASFTTSRFFAGVAARHINEPSYYSIRVNQVDEDINNDSTLSKIPISYNFMAGYNIRLFNTLIELEPMVFYESNADSHTLSGALQMCWDRKYSAGAMWRKDAGYSLFASVVFSNIIVRYAFDKNRRDNGIDFGPNHEFVVQYKFDMGLFKPKPQPYKSIRLL